MKDSPDTSTPQLQFPAVIDSDIGGASEQTGNARDLQAFINVDRHFAAWIKERMAHYGFTCGADYAAR